MTALDDYLAGNNTQPSTPVIPSGGNSALDNAIAPIQPKTALDNYLQTNRVPSGRGISLPVAQKPESFSQKYTNFSNRVGQLGAEMDVGVMKGLGGIAGGLATVGNWIMTPLNNAMDKVTNTKHQDVNIGDSMKTFAEHLDTGVKSEDKTYLDHVFEGLGTAVPYIAGGYASTALKIPALVSSLGIGSIQALDTAKNDYKQMVDSGDKNAGKKAAGVFAVDLALNTVAHFLGPLSQGGKAGILPSVGRILKSTVFETANFGVGQTITSNVANGRAPMSGVWDAVLVMAPISLAFGASGEMANSANIKAQQNQIKGIIHETIKNGGTIEDATNIISKLSGISEGEVKSHVENFVKNDPTLQSKHEENKQKYYAEIRANVEKAIALPKPVAESVGKSEVATIKPSPISTDPTKYASAEEYVKAQYNAYHGTNVKFDTFDKSKLGVSTNAKSAEKGFWFVDKKDVAKGYGEYASEKPVRDILDQIKIEEKKGNWDKANELTIKSEEMSATYSDPVVIQAKLNLENPMIYDAKGKGFLATDKKVNDLIDMAIKNGNDGLIVKNLEDNVYSSNVPATHTIVFNDKSIKTKSQLTEEWNKANEGATKTPVDVEKTTTKEFEASKVDTQTAKVEESKTAKSGLAKGTEEKAFKAGLELDHPNIPESEKMNMEKTRKEATDFVNKDPEMAKRVLNHEEGAELPPNLREGAIYTAMRLKAIEEKDINTLMFLTESKAAAEAGAEKGREVKAYDDGTNTGDPVKIAKNINKELAGKLNKKTGKNVDKEMTKGKKEFQETSEKVKKEVLKKVARKQTLEDFINSIKC